MHIYMCVCEYVHIYKGRLKNSYYDIISAVDNFFDQWNPSTSTPMLEVCGLQGRLMLKNKPHLVTFYESILVILWTFSWLSYIYIYIYIYIYNERFNNIYKIFYCFSCFVLFSDSWNVFCAEFTHGYSCPKS